MSALYHVSSRVQALLELEGERPLSGPGEGSEHFLAPGVKFRPLRAPRLFLGAAYGLPLHDLHDDEGRFVVSALFHF